MPPLTTARHTSQKTWFTRSPRASLLFFLGVFFTFAPVMTLLGQMESPSPIAVAFWFVVSGVCGVLWALTSVSTRWLLVAIPAQITAAMLGPRRWMGPFYLPVSGYNPIGVISVGSIALGYACFLTCIVVYSRRAMRLGVEMDLAAQIHRYLVPEISLREGGFEVAARSDASGAMGGDLVHAGILADGSAEAIVADVAGHGVRAGVVMAMVRSALESHRTRRGDAALTAADGPASLSALAADLNRVLSALTEPDVFVTAAMVHVAPDGALSAITAGHPPILVRTAGARGTAGGAGTRTLGGPDFPLGVIPDAPAATILTDRLGPGESLVLYTDGLTEASIPRGRRLEVEGLAAIVERAPQEAAAAVDAILAGVIAAAAPGPPEDDRTVLVLRRVP